MGDLRSLPPSLDLPATGPRPSPNSLPLRPPPMVTKSPLLLPTPNPMSGRQPQLPEPAWDSASWSPPTPLSATDTPAVVLVTLILPRTLLRLTGSPASSGLTAAKPPPPPLSGPLELHCPNPLTDLFALHAL